jgi:hypothetical protein
MTTMRKAKVLPRKLSWVLGLLVCTVLVLLMLMQYQPIVCADDPGYGYTYAIIAALEARGITTALEAGSHLGAKRHHGVQPFGDKDIDLAVFSTDYSKIHDALREVGLGWEENPEGFGYHLGRAQGLKGTQLYIDLWLYERTEEGVRCVGIDNGCHRWAARHGNTKDPDYPDTPMYNDTDWFPLRKIHFGAQSVNAPHSDSILVRTYGDDWQHMCPRSSGSNWRNNVLVPCEELIFRRAGWCQSSSEGWLPVHITRSEPELRFVPTPGRTKPVGERTAHSMGLVGGIHSSPPANLVD